MHLHFFDAIAPYFNFVTTKGNEAAFSLLGGGKVPAVGKVRQAHLILKRDKSMSINDILQSGTNVQLVVNALDLKEAFLQWSEEARKEEPREENYLTAKETAEKLGVDVSTLWRWDKSGYLKKIKVGNAIRYRESDVTKLMEG